MHFGGDESARYWGALNDLRRLREDICGRCVPLDDDQHGDSALLPAVFFLWVGAPARPGWTWPPCWGPPERWLEWLMFAVLYAVPGLLLVGGVWALVARGTPRALGRESLTAAVSGRPGEFLPVSHSVF